MLEERKTQEEVFQEFKKEAEWLLNKCNRLHKSKEYTLGAFEMLESHFATEMFCAEAPKLVKPNKHQKKRFTLHEDCVATDFDVALNKLFGKEITAGETYHITIRPYGVFTFDDRVYPVYDDDPGQQDYSLIEGEFISGGSYNLDSVSIFTDHIFSNYCRKLKAQLN